MDKKEQFAEFKYAVEPMVVLTLHKFITEDYIWPFMQLEVWERCDATFTNTINFNNIGVKDLKGLSKLFSDAAQKLEIEQEKINQDNETLKKAKELVK